MKKRILGCLLVVGMALTQVLTAGAYGSKGNQFDVVTPDYEIEIKDNNPNLDDLPDDAKEELKDKTPITPVVTVKPTGDPEKVPSTKDPNKEVYRIEFYVPNLNKDMLPELYTYYYWGDGEWDIVTSVEIDYENQTVVFEFEHLPFDMIIFAELIDLMAAGDSPKTGVASVWTMWMGAAVVLGSAAVVMSRKKRA